MMKKQIRLTESDLHRIVKESVNRILTELDWKTYQNAAEKAYERAYTDDWQDEWESEKGLDRSERFGKAAEKAFDKQYPRERGRLYHAGYDTMGYKQPQVSYDGPYDTLDDVTNGSPGVYKQYKTYHGGFPAKGHTDVYNYGWGKSKYIKGKGWQ